MQFTRLLPKQSLNKAYLKEKLSRSAIDQFKQNFSVFLNHTNANQNDEEHLKSQVAYFLRDTWYKDSHHINPIGKNDLVIHTGKTTADPVGVIIEVKSLTNKAEMIALDKPNAKAFHELVLYYLRQRLDVNNNEIKYLIATNIDEWFIFDANEFDKKIFRNTAVKRLFELKKADGKDNPWFYDELKKLLAQQDDLNFELTHFNLRDFEQVILNADRKDDNKLIGIYKLLSPVHLLKLPFANDSNSLQPKFYAELLHLIGLTEIKEGSKKLIQRRKAGDRHSGSLLENAINALDTHDKISRLNKPSQYGDNYEERLFNVALELVITWVNRILFLKLLEAQLSTYHKSDKSYKFLNNERIKDFDDLDKLFFSVLAKKPEERRDEINKLFGKVPYLNSSLFEPTELEHQTLFIYGLEDRVALPVLSTTVLKNQDGKTLKGSLHTIDYLFAFLDAYDFSSEGSEEIQEDNKTLINASVLGLIFEKINGYKDGSFFTPGFITMYMCRETIRRAVVQKFNDLKGWECKEYAELYDKIDDNREANEIINSLKICDPAVGSGHFLVSALNEILALKSDLHILQDRDGRRLKEYHLEVVNDELIITDEDGQLFDYNPKSRESLRVQEALFHEKQTIIENCLFGVDINPNSVKICRLRLWIELLKNAYYKENGQLETLPNIDINIKTGNSLISRFALDADLKQALKKSKYGIEEYKIAVQTYRHAKDKEEKREMERLIKAIKSDFRTEIGQNSKEVRDLNKLTNELFLKYQSGQLFDSKVSKAQIKDRERIEKEIAKLSAGIKAIKENRIYENAFEWRFEFPEVLNDEGDFVGFDVVIGNPPYGILISKSFEEFYKVSYPLSAYKPNLYSMFIERFALNIRGNEALLSFIIPDSLLFNTYYSKLRQFLLKHTQIFEMITCEEKVFDEAEVGKSLIFILKTRKEESNRFKLITATRFRSSEFISTTVEQESFLNNPNFTINTVATKLSSIFEKIKLLQPLESQYSFRNGLNPGNVKHILISRTADTSKHKPIIWGRNINKYEIVWAGDFINYNPKIRDQIAIESVKSKTGMNSQNRIDFALRSPDMFEVDKIVVRKTGDKIIAAIDRGNFYFDTLVHGVYCKATDKLYTLEYLVGILNSKFATFIYQNLYDVKGKAFAKISLDKLSLLPLAPADPKMAKLIGNLVDEIYRCKPENSGEVLVRIIAEIDQLVYQLYGLTEEEIKIVEGEAYTEPSVITE